MTDKAEAAAPVPTRKEDVVEVLHGVEVRDPYRWLENADDAEVKAWTAGQNAAMRRALDAVPGRKAIADRLWQLHEIGSLGVPVVKGGDPPLKAGAKPASTADAKPARLPQPSEGKSTQATVRGGGKRVGGTRRYFSARRTGKQNQPVLYVREGVEGRDRVLVDVNQLASDGTKSLDWWFPSEDGNLIAYGVSSNGDEISVLRVRDVQTGEDLPDEIPRTRAASVAWMPDGKSFYYTRYPDIGSVPKGQEAYHRHVYLHRLGTDPKKDPKIFGAGRDLKDWPSVSLSPNGRHLVIEVSQGWTKNEIYLIDTRAKKPTPVTVVAGRNALFNVAEVLDDRLYIVANEDAPRYRVFTANLKNPVRAAWKEIIPQGEETLQGISVVGDTLAALTLKDASSRVKLYDREGVARGDLPLTGIGTVGGLTGQHHGSELFFSFVSYLAPTTIFRYDLVSKATSVWKTLHAPIDATAFEVGQIRATSKDGTPIPMFVVHKRGLARDGTNPTLLYGYGGFNVSLTPGFAASIAPFLEKGGIYVVANLRGGAEYGEDWHRAGMLGKKQNTFDDFIAVAEHLIREKYTSPQRLAISGRSNGGLLTSAAVTQRPELFRAVISGVPLTDMIRYHKFRIAQLWIPEYGSSEDPDAFKWLWAYSPYHRVKDGVAYPSVLLFTAESDTRVDALHARKMAARLQAATSSPRPILLRLESQAGHGAGKPLAKVIEQYTDELAFLFAELGMTGVAK